MSSDVTRLRVGNEDFLVAAMIERCPKTMMVRELLKNALEAASGAAPRERRVLISAVPVGGVPKLAFWNSGRGMNGQELRRMCNIATSIRKEAGLDRNFGMGAKVASLPSNQRGLRYRSAHDGAVREVLMGKVEGVYGRLLRPGPDGKASEVLDVTAAAGADGRDPAAEWTEVVLFGNDDAQNTVADPYGGHPKSQKDWLLETVRSRFMRLPEGTVVEFQAGVGGLKAPRPLVTLGEHLAGLADYEAVKGPDGVVIHYAFDPMLAEQGPGPGPWDRQGGLAAVVHQDELYAVEKGQGWLRQAPSFGIPFLARAVTVLVELPDSYPVLPEAYRAFLQYRHGRQSQVVLHDFAAMVEAHRPKWLIQRLAASVPSAAYVEEVRAEMGAMLAAMGVEERRMRRKPVLAEALPPQPKDRDAEPAERLFRAETAPAILLLRDPEEIAGRGLTHRAATYYPETHQLHVNLAHPAVAEAAEALAADAPGELDAGGVQEAARLAAEKGVVARISRMLVHAFGKRGRNKEWNESQVRTVLSPEVLTLAADDARQGTPEMRAAFEAALRTVPKAAEEAAPDAA